MAYTKFMHAMTTMTTNHHPSSSRVSQNSIAAQLPPEILSHIFWYATAASSSSPPAPDPDRPYDLLPNSPLSDRSTFFHLRATCFSWRCTIHSSHTIQISLSVNSVEREIHPDIPWNRVGSLKLNDVRPEYACQLLSLCPNLVEFTFDQKSDLGGDGNTLVLNSPLQEVVLDIVQTLRWVASDTSASSAPADDSKTRFPPLHPDFFKYFRFPATRTLQWNAPLPPEAHHIRAFFESMSQVETLHLSPSFTKHTIDQYLDVFINITKLVMKTVDHEGDEGWTLLQRLTIKPNHKENLFPQLQTMCLTVSSSDIDPDGLIVLLYSRRNSPVDWSDPRQLPGRLTLPPYDPTSPHWQRYTRLTMFSVMPEDDEVEFNWGWGEHYTTVMEPMFEEAKRVDEFLTMWSESLIIF